MRNLPLFFRTYKNILTITIITWFIGPLLMLGSVLSGAEVGDTFAADPVDNSPLQEKLLGVGSSLTILMWIISSVVTAVISGYRSKSDKRYRVLPYLSLVVPLALLIIVAIVGI